ncbi:MAG: SCO family protein [Bacteroidia bacterium]
MKQAITLFSSLILILCMNSCSNSTETGAYYCPMKCEGEKVYTESGSCPVCHMDLVPVEEDKKVIEDENAISEASIFNLSSKWNTQNNETIELKELKGDVLVMVMIYTTCKAACPRLVADMRSISEKVDDGNVRYVLVSIDPENDTPEKLKKFAIENNMDTEQWVFLQGTVDDVREFSNVLAVKYKQISPIDFSHSNIISVFNKKGELHHQQEGLGVDNTETVNSIIELTK